MLLFLRSWQFGIGIPTKSKKIFDNQTGPRPLKAFEYNTLICAMNQMRFTTMCDV